jgi:NADH-quinone oxidoreductase subunit L
VGAYTAAIFHLMTHAFFKGLLFLGSGSVIHGMSNEQDIRHMGGLKDKMPKTFVTFLIGTIAIAGVPGLAGFFSKDEILWKTFESQHYALWVIGITAAFCTAFYMFRLLYLTFYGKFRGSKAQDSHVHESPGLMTFPLIVLAGLSIVGGYIGLPHALGGSNQFGAWLEPLIKTRGTEQGELQIGTPTAEYVLMILSIAVALIGIYLAKKWYVDKSETPAALSKTGFYKLIYNKYWVDQIYDTLISKPLVKASEINSKYVEAGIVDGFYKGLASFFYNVGSITRRMQTGALHDYLVFMAAGLILVLSVFLFTL